MFRCALIVGATVVAVASCGTTDEACYADRVPELPTSRVGWDCSNAKSLAARDVAGPVVTQAELDLYLDVYWRAFAPLEDVLGRPPHAASWWSEPYVDTTRSAVVAAWNAGSVVTGNVAIDSVLQAAHIDSVDRAPNSTLYALRSRTHAVVSRAVADALTALNLPDLQATASEFHFAEPSEEITIEGPVGARAVVFQIGWGDCFVECLGQHFWRVDVASAVVTAEWGDEIPLDVLEYYRAIVPYD